MRSTAMVAVLLLCACEEPSNEGPDSGAVMRPTPPPDCIGLPASIDFGEIATNGLGDMQFLLVNRTFKTMELDFGEVAPPFSTSTVGTVSLTPDQTMPFHVLFSPPDALLHVSEFSFTGGKGCNPQRVHLQGVGRGGLEVPATLEFDNLPVGVVTTKTLLVRNTRREPLTVQIEFVPEPPLYARVTLFDVPALGSFELPLELKPTRAGTTVSRVSLKTPQGERATTVVIASAGSPAIAADRASIDVSMVPLGSGPAPITRSFVVSNTGVADLRVERLEVVATAPSVQTELEFDGFVGARIAPGEFTLVPFALKPIGAPGPRAWTVRVFSNDPARPVLEVAVTATVIPLMPCTLAVAPSVEPLQLSGPYPSSISFTLSNPNAETCLVDGFQFLNCAAALTVDPADEQFTIAGQGTRSFTLTATAPSSCGLRYRTWGGPATSVVVSAP
ncbi:MAG: hypothetical protein U0228_38105 [Myxococcaceae bacterium]